MDPVHAKALNTAIRGLLEAGTVIIDGSKQPKFLKNLCVNTLKGVEEAVETTLITEQVQKKFEILANTDAEVIKRPDASSEPIETPMLVDNSSKTTVDTTSATSSDESTKGGFGSD